ncbi:MAG: zinc ABC transporter substrate-binding protein [Devosia sp.]
MKSTLAALAASLALAEVPRVVASVKPIHALVAEVMGDLGTPDLIVDGASSPHTYSLKPSNAAALQNADLVFWTGHGLELFLEDSIGTLAPNATIVELADAPGIELLAPREGGTFEPHDDEAHAEEGHDDHAHEGEHDHDNEAERDMHFFLDPENAKAMVAAIAENLAAADPDNAATYTANAAAASADLDALIAETEATLAPVTARPFVVFHDAYQYFENRFGLTVAGSITISPELAPGADRITAIRKKLSELDAACVFAEPNFDPRVVDVLIEGTGAGSATLDPEGANLTAGPGLYRELITSLADDLVACLS